LLAAGRPVIVAEAHSEAALVLREEDIGWVVKPEDRSAESDRDKTSAKGCRAALTAKRYTYDRAVASYRQVMNDVMRAAR
jgi:colanic acid biosynthesis glycosyl transferase WcaI